jgi:hypothetical protein
VGRYSPLFCEWDPIWVMDDPEWPRDEYDCMVGPCLRLLEEGAPEGQIEDYLFWQITGARVRRFLTKCREPSTQPRNNVASGRRPGGRVFADPAQASLLFLDDWKLGEGRSSGTRFNRHRSL